MVNKISYLGESTFPWKMLPTDKQTIKIDRYPIFLSCWWDGLPEPENKERETTCVKTINKSIE